MAKKYELDQLTHRERKHWWESLPFGITLYHGGFGHRGGTTNPRNYRKTLRSARKRQRNARKAHR